MAVFILIHLFTQLLFLFVFWFFVLCCLLFLNTSFFLLETCVNLSVHCRRLKESSCRSSYVRERCPVLCGQCNTSTMKPSTTKPIVSRSMYRSSQRWCSKKKVFLKMLQNLREKACVRVSFLIKFQASNFIKKAILAQVCEFCKIFKNTFFTEHLCTTAYLCISSKVWSLQIPRRHRT